MGLLLRSRVLRVLQPLITVWSGLVMELPCRPRYVRSVAFGHWGRGLQRLLSATFSKVRFGMEVHVAGSVAPAKFALAMLMVVMLKRPFQLEGSGPVKGVLKMDNVRRLVRDDQLLGSGDVIPEQNEILSDVKLPRVLHDAGRLVMPEWDKSAMVLSDGKFAPVQLGSTPTVAEIEICVRPVIEVQLVAFKVPESMLTDAKLKMPDTSGTLDATTARYVSLDEVVGAMVMVEDEDNVNENETVLFGN